MGTGHVGDLRPVRDAPAGSLDPERQRRRTLRIDPFTVDMCPGMALTLDGDRYVVQNVDRVSAHASDLSIVRVAESRHEHLWPGAARNGRRVEPRVTVGNRAMCWRVFLWFRVLPFGLPILFVAVVNSIHWRWLPA